MKFKGGRTIQNNKNGDIVYESEANPKHIVGETEFDEDIESIRAIKFEERLRKRSKIPIRYLSDIEHLVNFSPFSYNNGSPKYVFYKYSKVDAKKLENRPLEKIYKLILDSKKMGMQKAFKKNNANKDLNRVMKPFLNTSINLDSYWQQSMKQFLNGE